MIFNASIIHFLNAIYVCREERQKIKEEILSGFPGREPASYSTTRLRTMLRPGKRQGGRVTAKGHYEDFLLFLDEKKQKSPTGHKLR